MKSVIQMDEESRRRSINEVMKDNRIFGFTKGRDLAYPYFTEPNPLQARLLEAWKDSRYKVFTYSGGNRIGKTTLGAIVAISTVLGEWPWSGEKMVFPHGECRKVRYVGQAWESHVKAVVEPALRLWWPKSVHVETRKNNQGIDYFWKCGSRGSLEIMSNVQTSDVFEGWNGDLVVYDEPPKRDVRVACARGLIDRKGRELFCMTLLKEAWIHREVVKAVMPDGTPDMTVFNVNGDIYSNVGYGITEEGIAQFAKTLTEDEKQARLYGKPSYMSSLVCPKFDRLKHVVEPFKVPLDWIVDFEIDFHPSKPWAVVFMATAKNGFKYVCRELELRGNPKYVGEEIVRCVREGGWRIGRGQIDPLAKGDENNDMTVYEILSQTLASYGISLETASKDKENGISILNNLLWTENEMPGLFFFRTCPHSITQTEDWMYDPETFKPSKKEDDFAECLYRLALLDTQWTAPANFDMNLQKNVIL